MVSVIARWLVNPSEEVWLVYRQVPGGLAGALAAWSLFMRIALRRGLLLPDAPRLMLLASDEEMAAVLHAWVRVAASTPGADPLALEQLLNEGAAPLLVALSPRRRRDPSLSGPDRTARDAGPSDWCRPCP